jgi:hypothetical protein
MQNVAYLWMLGGKGAPSPAVAPDFDDDIPF